jgi:hypothetical protein
LKRAVVELLLAALLVQGCDSLPGAPDPSDFAEVPGLGAPRIDVPRPTSPTRSTCGADGLPTPSAESIEARVGAFRSIGLFASRGDATDAEVAAEVEDSIKARWGDQIGPDEPLLDLFVAEQDRARVWWQDLEADVSDGNEVYAQTLADWGGISVGSFDPEAIVERWESDSGPVTVTFELDGIEHILNPAYIEDWIDLQVLGEVNGLIASSGRRFESYRAFDQSAFVISLTPDERAALEHDRGWCFE